MLDFRRFPPPIPGVLRPGNRAFEASTHMRELRSGRETPVHFGDSSWRPQLSVAAVGCRPQAAIARRRLSGTDKNMIPQLAPALQAFKSQHGVQAEARRSAADIHDRWPFVDRATCFQSGASKAPTTLTQLQDMFTVVHQQYETIWTGSPVI
jgi:hypothetical protein